MIAFSLSYSLDSLYCDSVATSFDSLGRAFESLPVPVCGSPGPAGAGTATGAGSPGAAAAAGPAPVRQAQQLLPLLFSALPKRSDLFWARSYSKRSASFFWWRSQLPVVARCSDPY